MWLVIQDLQIFLWVPSPVPDARSLRFLLFPNVWRSSLSERARENSTCIEYCCLTWFLNWNRRSQINSAIKGFLQILQSFVYSLDFETTIESREQRSHNGIPRMNHDGMEIEKEPFHSRIIQCFHQNLGQSCVSSNYFMDFAKDSEIYVEKLKQRVLHPLFAYCTFNMRSHQGLS